MHKLILRHHTIFASQQESKEFHTTMGEKRKAEGRAFGNDDAIRKRDNGSKLRINTYEDVADSEDEFHINRDKIILEEGPAQKRQRKLREEGNFTKRSTILI